MITRKVQAVGYSTLIVSLPREWTREIGLKKGDTISFRKNSDGSLKLIPGTENTQREKVKCIINSDACDDPKLLSRIITGSYILGHDTIQVISDTEIKTEQFDEVRDSIRRLAGIGIMEQTLSEINIQCFIDSSKFPAESLMRRLHAISLTMQRVAMKALLEVRLELAIEVINMEAEANRIYWLILRQLLSAVRDESTKEELDPPMSYARIVGDRVIAQNIETMADYSKNIAQETLKIIKNDLPISKSLQDLLCNLDILVQESSSKMINAFYDYDLKSANESIENTKKIEAIEKRIVERIFSEINDAKMANSLRIIAYSLKRIAGCSDSIAEITINRIVGRGLEGICKLARI